MWPNIQRLNRTVNSWTFGRYGPILSLDVISMYVGSSTQFLMNHNMSCLSNAQHGTYFFTTAHLSNLFVEVFNSRGLLGCTFSFNTVRPDGRRVIPIHGISEHEICNAKLTLDQVSQLLCIVAWFYFFLLQAKDCTLEEVDELFGKPPVGEFRGCICINTRDAMEHDAVEYIGGAEKRKVENVGYVVPNDYHDIFFTYLYK